ncbi:MAG: SMC-Scp complex subunit ScpB [Frankiaceae bacterium]
MFPYRTPETGARLAPWVAPCAPAGRPFRATPPNTEVPSPPGADYESRSGHRRRAPRRTQGKPDVATEVRRRRELLGWSQAEAARRSGVSRTVINEIESGRRVPEVRTYEKLRGALGLALPAAIALLRRPAPGDWTERQLATLAGCLLTGRGGTLAALADAAGVPIPAVREQVSKLGDRLAACGMAAVEDGDVVRLIALPWAAEAMSSVATLEVEHTLSPEAVEVLAAVSLLATPTRRDIEHLRGGEDCERLLARMCQRGLLEKARDDTLRGDPSVYRLTALAVGVMGHTTAESFQARCAEVLPASPRDGSAGETLGAGEHHSGAPPPSVT